ncbi:MAG: hypothetical protein AAGL96_17925 [Pseudomonadota bacterium]
MTTTGDPGAPRSILLATPSYGDSFCGDFVHGLQNLARWTERSGIGFNTLFMDYADIVASRNILTTLFLFEETAYTHLLFIDDDMGFSHTLVADALAFDPGLCGAFYPRRRVDMAKLHAGGDKPFETALARATQFVGEATPDPKHHGRFQTAHRIGTGFMLLSRGALQDFINKRPDLIHPSRYDNVVGRSVEKGWLTLFDRIEENGFESSEDYAFCARWRDAGGEIWAARDAGLTHMGRMQFSSRWDKR